MKKKPLRIFAALTLLLVMGVILLQASRILLFAYSPAERGSERIVPLSVEKGHGSWKLARDLESKGVVTSASEFHRVGRLFRKWQDLKVGEYELSPSMSPMQIYSILSSGVSVQYSVTIPEGHNMFQIADTLAAKGLVDRATFLRLCKDQEFLATLELGATDAPRVEGYLFPETYFFNRAINERDIIRLMVGKANQIWTPEREEKGRALGFNRHQVITLASIIEKETGAPEERPLISSVFHNRLRKRMRLQSDPTTIYGIWERFTGNLRRSHLREKTVYNTYTIPSLPVGPIANPGIAAIDAALSPAKSEYLFFVSKNDGTHVFTTNLADHEKAVRDYQINRAAREGKSWRDRLNPSERQ